MGAYTAWREIKTDKRDEADVMIMGIAFDGAASVGKGAAKAPDQIRECSTVLPPVNLKGEMFPDLRVYDAGDVEFTLDWEKYYGEAERMATDLFKTGKTCIFLGGDHSVHIPLQKALGKAFEGKKIGIIHFDSHPDLCEDYQDSKWSHACPLKRATDETISYRDLAQVGIRSYEAEEIELFKNHPELLVIKAYDIFKEGYQAAIDKLVKNFEGYDVVYITLDIDVLDPAYAPGTGTPEAGGLTSNELMEIVNQLFEKLPLVGMDIVEVSPPLDTINNTTSWAAVKLMYEVFAQVAKK